MPRCTHRLVTVLLWLAMALLPLRGLAGVLMHGGATAAQGPGSAATELAGSTGRQAAQSMPCHAVVQDTAVPMADMTVATPEVPAATHSCAMCDLCHTTVAHGPVGIALLAAPHEAQPLAEAPSAIEPRPLEGPYRPPRASLA